MANEKDPKDGAPQDGTKPDDGDILDPEVEAIAKDPKAVKALLEAKRAANAEAKKLRLEREEAAKAEKAKSDAALAEQGKFKELLEQEKTKGTTLAATYSKRLADLYLKIEAKAADALDEDAVVALAVRDGIKVGDDLSVEGVKEAVEALKKAKPHLFGKDEQKVAPPKGGVPAPRAPITIKPGENAPAHVDLAAAFARK